MSDIFAWLWILISIGFWVTLIMFIVNKLRKRSSKISWKTPLVLFVVGFAFLIAAAITTDNSGNTNQKTTKKNSSVEKENLASSNSTNTESTSSKASSAKPSLSEEDQDKQILADYTAKIQAQTPKSIASYNEKAKSNQDGMQGLAKLSTDEVSVLAGISTEGIEKMAKVMMVSGSGKQDTYNAYAAKLQDVYTAESQKIMDNYTTSAIGQ